MLAGGFDVETAVQEESCRCLFDAVYGRVTNDPLTVFDGMKDLEPYEQKCLRGLCDKMVKLLGAPVDALKSLSQSCIDNETVCSVDV